MSNVLTNSESGVDTYLADLAKTLEDYFPPLSTGRPREWALDTQFEKVMALNPGIFFVPTEHGGLGALVGESLTMLDLASYYRLSFGLAIGINSALFIWPLTLFGSDSAKSTVFPKIRRERKIGGLMLTEPGHGSDLLNMEAKFECRDTRHYHITGTKHWAGFTGRADYWLIAARACESAGGRPQIAFFLCEQDKPSQRIHVETCYDSAGLQPITYGRSRLNAVVPESHRLGLSRQGLDILRTTLSHSRMVICAMACGAVRRLRDESIGFAGGRMIGRRSLLRYDLTQFFIRQLDARLAILSALCRYLSRAWHLGVATVEQFEAARIIKVIATDYMAEASDRAVQIFASSGYSNASVPWVFFRDARAFRIFEGPNELLYTQIGREFITNLRQEGLCTLDEYLKEGGLHSNTRAVFQGLSEVRLVGPMTQTELWRIGVFASRLRVCDWLIQQEADQSVMPLEENAIQLLRAEAAAAINALRYDLCKEQHCERDNYEPLPQALAWWKVKESSRSMVTAR